METKEIVERVLKGEDYSTLVKDVPVEKQAEVGLAVRDAISSVVKNTKGEVDAETQKLIGVRKGITDIQAKKDGEIPNVLETFKKEQVEKAKRKFFSDPRYPVTAEQRIQIENELAAKGITSTDSDFVFDEIKKVYGSVNVDSLIAEREKAVLGAKGAAKFTTTGAGGSNTGPTGDPDKYSKGVRELWEAVVTSGHKNYTLDQAKESFEKGRKPNSVRIF
jgi:hypothetical protein